MKRLLLLLVVFMGFAWSADAQSLNAAQTKLRNEINSFLKEEGFMPSIDKDGSVLFKKEGTQYWVSVSDEDTAPMYVTIGAGFNKPDEYSLATIMLAAADLNMVKGVKVLCDEDSFLVQGEMFLGNAEQFKYSFYKIVSQIESVVYVFDEACKNNQGGSSSSSAPSRPSYGSSSSSSEPRIVNYPSIRTKGDNKLIIKRVVIADSYTALEFSSNNNHGSTYYSWCTIAKETHLICGGKNYALIKADGIKINPEKTYYSGSNSTINFTLYFEPIPRNATTIDFYEAYDSEWNTWGIKL
jgi:hypothetical protein